MSLAAEDSSDRKEFLYTVLNLPVSASQQEIRERYRALSVVFHPDKQHDERTKDTASKRFLEIQKAYEVLSDPFLREVYDILGEEGLALKWPPELQSQSKEGIRDYLKGIKRQRTREKLEDLIHTQGQFTYGLDLSSLFERNDISSRSRVWSEEASDRMRNVRSTGFGLRHSFQADLNDKTKLTITGRTARGGSSHGGPGGNVIGTVRHQYSPRLNFEATALILRDHILSVKSSYSDGDTTLTLRTHLTPYLFVLFPPVTAAVSRRLFRHSATEGSLTLNTGPRSSVQVALTSPAVVTPGQAFASYWTCGFSLSGLNSGLQAESGLVFWELALHLKLGFELGLQGLATLLTGSWQHGKGEVSASVGLSQTAVIMRLNLSYLGNRIFIPLTLSHDYDARVALGATVVPSAAFALLYHFVVRPKRRAKRVANFRTAKKELEEQMSARRETEETMSLLQETARRHMQAENSKAGLVILEASYGPTDQDADEDEVSKDLRVDVTVALQALVHNSQLHIPGHRPKSGLQGFFDPAPATLKSLKIRYSFRDRVHYAEILDDLPVTLPLENHLVE